MTLALVVGADQAPELQGVLWQRTIPSCIQRKQPVIDEMLAVMRSHHLLEPDDEHWLALCLDEALVNAIMHGNEADDTIPVSIAIGHDHVRWQVRIDDQGEGFTARDVPDQDDSDSLLLEHGRGIRLMCEWLDELRYYRGGATIVMGRRIPLEPKKTDSPHAL